MHCRSCKIELPEKAEFCPNCGVVINAEDEHAPTIKSSFASFYAGYSGYAAPVRDPSEPSYPSLPPPPKRRREKQILIGVIALLLLLASTGILVLFTRHTNTSALVKTTQSSGMPGQTPVTPTPADDPTSRVTGAPPSTPSPLQQAQAVVQTYYDDINAADYQDAYNQWGTSFQSTHPYSNFASGFADTAHDSITFNALSSLSDGTIQVSITLQAISSGNTTSTYQGYYIVGQENGRWKLLNANITQTS